MYKNFSGKLPQHGSLTSFDVVVGKDIGRTKVLRCKQCKKFIGTQKLINAAPFEWNKCYHCGYCKDLLIRPKL